MRRFSDFYKKVNEQEELATVNFNDPKDLEVEPVASMNPIIKSLSDGEGGSLDVNFQKLLEFQMQVKVFHWGTEIHSEHIASDITYVTLNEVMDTLVEAYQGQYGLIKLQPVSGLDTNNDIKNVIAYFDKLITAVAKLRKDEKLQMSWLQNDIDTIVTLLYSTKYKLTNLQ